MRGSKTWRLTLVSTVAALAMAAPGREGVAGSLPPPGTYDAALPAPPAPERTAPGPVTLPDRLIQDAAAYASYMHEAVAISPNFTDARSVTLAVDKARAYAPAAMVRGAVAYGAIAALEDQAFVTSLRDAGASPDQRRQMVSWIIANPNYVYGFRGAYAAAGLVKAAVGPASLRLYETGKAVRQAAYDIQKQGWSKLDVGDLKARLADAEAAAGQEMPAAPERLTEARQSVTGDAPLPIAAAPLAPPYTPMITHALQLAAIAALGEARDEAYQQLAAIAADSASAECLSRAKRNFHQCLAVARPNYEDVFCSGQHALLDTGACMAQAVGTDVPVSTPRLAKVDF